jgi:hypothetical protein
MNDLIQFAENEFGFPVLNAEFDHMKYMLEQEKMLGSTKNGECFIG